MKNIKFKAIFYLVNILFISLLLTLYVLYGIYPASFIFVIICFFTFVISIVFRFWKLLKFQLPIISLIMLLMVINDISGKLRYNDQFEIMEKLQKIEINQKIDLSVSHGATGAWEDTGFAFLVSTKLNLIELQKYLSKNIDLSNFKPIHKMSLLPRELNTFYDEFENNVIPAKEIEIKDSWDYRNNLNSEDLKRSNYLIEIFYHHSVLLN